jgi:hypothetical protein
LITFAGVRLLMQTPELDAWLRMNRLTPFDLFGSRPDDALLRTAAKGRADPRVPFPRPNYSPCPDPKINVLHWPTGASRYASFVGVVGEDGLRKILKSFTAEPSPAGTLLTVRRSTLIVGDSEYVSDLSSVSDGWHSDGVTHFAVKTQMQLLDPRPITLTESGQSLWLLPMVDIRYWWQHSRYLPHRLPATWIPDGTTEVAMKETWNGWGTVFQYAVDPELLVSDREVSLTAVPPLVDSTGSESEHAKKWFFPDRTELDRPLEPVGPLMDAWAHSMGRRVVRQFSGLVEVIDVESSQTRHNDTVVGLPAIVAGSPHLMVKNDSEIDDLNYRSTMHRPPYVAHQVFPQWVDVSFRQLVEFDGDLLPDDLPDAFGDTTPPSGFEFNKVIHGPGVRTIRNNLVHDTVGIDNNITIHDPGQRKHFRCASWVGRVFWSEATDGRVPVEPLGVIDSAFYGDRYFRLSRTIANNYVTWSQQRHEYSLPKFYLWELSGFDDVLTIDHDAAITHVRSHRGDFGIDSFLVQVHQQTEFAPDQVVGLISSEWTLYPKELEQVRDPEVEGDLDCLLLTDDESIGTARELEITIQELTVDRFDASWQWAEAEVRPFIPADPHAVRGSIDYGRTMVWASESTIVGVTRSQKIVQALVDKLDCVTLAATDAPDDCPSVMSAERDDCFDWDRTDVLTSASGVSYLRRYGNEWQFIEIDCD